MSTESVQPTSSQPGSLSEVKLGSKFAPGTGIATSTSAASTCGYPVSCPTCGTAGTCAMEKAKLERAAWIADDEAAKLTLAAKAKSAEAHALRSQVAIIEAQQRDLETRAATANQPPGVLDRVRVGLDHAREAVVEVFVNAKDSITHTAQGAQQGMAEVSASAKEKIAAGLESLSTTAAVSGADFKKSAAADSEIAANQAAARHHHIELKAGAGAPPPDAPHLVPTKETAAAAAAAPAAGGLKESVAGMASSVKESVAEMAVSTKESVACMTESAKESVAGMKASVAGMAESAAHWTAERAKQVEASAGEKRADAQLAQGHLPHKAE